MVNDRVGTATGGFASNQAFSSVNANLPAKAALSSMGIAAQIISLILGQRWDIVLSAVLGLAHGWE